MYILFSVDAAPDSSINIDISDSNNELHFNTETGEDFRPSVIMDISVSLTFFGLCGLITYGNENKSKKFFP